MGRDQSPYAWTKATNTELVMNYGQWFGLEFAITYFYNVYGQREITCGEYATVLGIFRSQLRGMATQRPQQSRDRLREEIHQAIDDTARASSIARRFEDLDAGWTFPHADDEELDLLLTAA